MRKCAAAVLAVILMSHVMYVSAEMEGKTDVVPEYVTSAADEGDRETTSDTISGNAVSDQPESSSENNKVQETIPEEMYTDAPETDAEEKSTEESAETAEEDGTEAEKREQNDVIYNVSFPTGVKAFLDPGNLSGRGQIFSDRYAVENYGNTDIAILIRNIDVHYRSEEELYELTDEVIADFHSGVKKMNVEMVWENENEKTENSLHVLEGETDTQVLILRAAEYDENGEFVKLADGGRGAFYFTGTMNGNPGIVWENGEIAVDFNYEIFYLNAEQTGQTERKGGE